MTATIRIMTTNAFGIHSLPSGPVARSLSHFAAPPPGAFRTSRANPAQTNPIARVTTMSGTRVTITRPPLTAPSTIPRPSTSSTTTMANSSLWPFIIVAETTLVSAIIDPIERSIPPLITTMACATAASARGRIDVARPWSGIGP